MVTEQEQVHMAAEVEAIVSNVDGSDNIRVIVDCALRDDPTATAEEIADIVREARKHATAEADKA